MTREKILAFLYERYLDEETAHRYYKVCEIIRAINHDISEQAIRRHLSRMLRDGLLVLDGHSYMQSLNDGRSPTLKYKININARNTIKRILSSE